MFIPVAIEDIGRRPGLLKATCSTLAQALLSARGNLPSRVRIQLHLNGVPAGDGEFRPSAEIVEPAGALAATRGVAAENLPGAHVTWSAASGKIPAVNFALREARRFGYDLLLCVDADLVLPRSAIARTLECAAAKPRLTAVTAYKAPLVTAQASAFQRLYSYAFEMSFRHGIYPKRSTGSFYCLHPDRIGEFTSRCNEGDVLERLSHAYSGVIVQSPFPPTRDAEVARRLRLESASRASGHTRLHHDPAFLDDVDRHFRFPAALDRALYRRALSLSRGIVAEASERMRYENGYPR